MVSNSLVNHFQSVRELFATPAKRVIIASPYLANDLQELLSEFSFKNVESIELITTFKPYDPEQFCKPYILKEYFNFFQKNYPNIKVKLHVDNKLHGKIYISSFESQFTAIISSANFTRNGLIHNHEFGLKIDNAIVIESLIEDLFKFIDYQDITYNQISRACQFADQDKMNHPDLHIHDIYSNILDSVYSVDDSANINPNYFLKPIGDSEKPVLLKDKSDFSSLHQNLHFSKKKPKGIKKGDVIITTAVGGGALLSCFKVTGGLLEVTADEIATDSWKERWPWYMEGRNQATEFSSQWWLHNIQRNKTLNEFLEIYPNVPVTKAGGFTLGTLNMGNDKVKITKEFGDFLISKIENSKL